MVNILVTIYENWITMVNIRCISDVVFRKELPRSYV